MARWRSMPTSSAAFSMLQTISMNKLFVGVPVAVRPAASGGATRGASGAVEADTGALAFVDDECSELSRLLPQPCVRDHNRDTSSQNALIYRDFRCAREDSNLHELSAHKALNLARLPIPPQAQRR